jgi:hypothetical protein
MKRVAWNAKVQHAWRRFLRFMVVVEESTDRDFVTPLYRRLEALERETDELRGRLAQASAPAAEKVAG